MLELTPTGRLAIGLTTLLPPEFREQTAETSMFKSVSLLIFALSTVPAESQSAGETSVPEPTHLHTVAIADGSKLVQSELLGEIKSVDARATISAIEVEGSDGEQVRGVKITLENSTSTDQIYLADSQLSNLRDELEQLELSRQFDEGCDATRLCMHGIARCRPSQTVRQAYCLGRYSTPNSEEGLNLTTPRYSFMFPSVGTEQLDALINVAVQVLE